MHPAATSHPAPLLRPPGRSAAALRLTALLVVAVAAFGALLALGSRPPFDLPLDPHAWSDAGPLDALAAALRWVGLGASGWLLATTLVALACAVADGRRPVGTRRSHLAARVVPRALRLLAERAVLGGLALGVAAAPAAAQAARAQDPPVVTVVRDGRASDLASLPGVGPGAVGARPGADPPATAGVPANATGVPDVPDVPDGTDPAGVPPVALPAAGSHAVVVAPGEHLWELAARELAWSRGVPRDSVPEREVAAYWSVVCDVNRSRLASGDVDVVYPGETVVLPPVG